MITKQSRFLAASLNARRTSCQDKKGNERFPAIAECHFRRRTKVLLPLSVHDIKLGNIFDVSGQRDRAVNEYNLAARTRDDTQGAQEEAAKYLKQPYERKRSNV
jgi:hypothetical protein